MNTRTLVILTVCMVVFSLGVLMLMKPKHKEFNPDVMARSRKYIATLSARPLERLSIEDKLLLLHSYSNVREYASVIRISDALGKDWLDLPPVRQKPFIQMIDEAYFKLGRKKEAEFFQS